MRHVGSYHECAWSRPACIVNRLAWPGMENEVVPACSPVSDAQYHVDYIHDEYSESEFVPESYWTI